MRNIVPPRRLSAEIFHQELHGQHQALLLSGRGPSGLLQAVVKLSARVGLFPTPYLCEWVAISVASALGVKVPEPLAVDISQAFADSISDERVRRDAVASCGVSFGCRFLPHYAEWTPSMSLHPDLREAASLLLAFDIFVHNFDRTATNSNLLFRREELVAIDHELAFEFVYPSGCANPVLDPRRDVIEKHAFRQALRGKLSDLEDFRDGVRSLSDAWLDALRQATPNEWVSGQGAETLDRILAVLRGRRDHLDEWLDQVSAWME